MISTLLISLALCTVTAALPHHGSFPKQAGIPTTFPASDYDDSDFNPVFVHSGAAMPSTDGLVKMDGRMVNMDVDGVMAPQHFVPRHPAPVPVRPIPAPLRPAPKKQIKQPNQKKFTSKSFKKQMHGVPQVPIQQQAFPPYDALPKEEFDFSKPIPGVAPKFSGSFAKDDDKPAEPFGNFRFGEDRDGPVTNPAATFLAGGNFNEMSAPQCRMVGCVGPLPNDGSINLEAPSARGSACHQTFVPMNGCTNNKGYPMGMLCSICCECSKPFLTEMRKTVGYKQGITF